MFFYVPMTHDSKKTLVPSPTEQLICACKPTHCKPYVLAAVWRAGCQSIGIVFQKMEEKKNWGSNFEDSIPTRTVLCQQSMKFPWKFLQNFTENHRSAALMAHLGLRINMFTSDEEKYEEPAQGAPNSILHR